MSYLDRYFHDSPQHLATLRQMRQDRDSAMLGIQPLNLRLSTIVNALAVHHSLHKDKDPQLDGINGWIHQQVFIDDADRLVRELDSRITSSVP